MTDHAHGFVFLLLFSVHKNHQGPNNGQIIVYYSVGFKQPALKFFGFKTLTKRYKKIDQSKRINLT